MFIFDSTYKNVCVRKTVSTNYQNETELINQCPLMYALSKIGNRWKPYILWKLKNKKLRFGEIKREIPSITERMLILSLKELKEAGLVNRKNYNQIPPKVEYFLTAMGRKLQPVLDGLNSWGNLMLKK